MGLDRAGRRVPAQGARHDALPRSSSLSWGTAVTERPAPQIAASWSELEPLRAARAIIRQEAEALSAVAGRLDMAFCEAIAMVGSCRGRVVVMGVGKAGLIGRKIAATLASLGIPAHFVHPTEAMHGDLGCLASEDVVLALSNSGETAELCAVLPRIRRRGCRLVAVTGRRGSRLAAAAEVAIVYGPVSEAGTLALAPTTSTTAMLAVGDALALLAAQQRGTSVETFAENHPAGALGLKLTKVREVMRTQRQLRIAHQDETVREVFTRHRWPQRRTGAVILCDDAGRLVGLFTDSDLARLLEQRREDALDRPVRLVMTRRPTTVSPDDTLQHVVTVLSNKKISELPVVNHSGRPVGLVDITDVIGLMPAEFHEAGSAGGQDEPGTAGGGASGIVGGDACSDAA
ncbi:MAG: KpsF/GutQ family sugar-phosphate isomerase [Planctomycetota bacterium]|nr:MAG: KpsF/GutQ family sugar-phosphate isomerase [Planctomycetota bacterium]